MLGWTAATALQAVLVDGHAVLCPAPPGGAPAAVPVRADGAGRLLLPVTVVAALALAGGDQVLAVALPGEAELHLYAAADALQLLTGARRPADPAAGPSAPVRPVPRPRTRVRPAWRPQLGPAPGGECATAPPGTVPEATPAPPPRRAPRHLPGAGHD